MSRQTDERVVHGVGNETVWTSHAPSWDRIPGTCRQKNLAKLAKNGTCAPGSGGECGSLLPPGDRKGSPSMQPAGGPLAAQQIELVQRTGAPPDGPQLPRIRGRKPGVIRGVREGALRPGRHRRRDPR